MDKKMHGVRVYTTKDHEIALQAPDWGQGEQSVFISPEQAETLAEWILEAKAELLAGEENDD